ncbi:MULTISPECIES: PP2C family protein-serine/threonine phosphatase [Burkholderia]|uniref:PP2C family protein-serine/threonine phosphatase n=1 Tax=Burkholderia TaxID=32008 RepID=UPI0009E3E6F0|nr:MULTISPECIES: protein phosphatase 2C domain-containing protein [Burkholderia]UVE66980.1 protein phosphatase 2C domain-containing protein [Burkholderia pyrrocinia]
MSAPALTPTTKLTAWFMRRTAAGAVRRVAPLNAAVASDVGLTRTENQDRVALVRGSDRNGAPFILAAVADGIGGMKRGAECASLTLATVIDTVVRESKRTADPSEWLRSASDQANRAVHSTYGGNGGSTLVAVVLAFGHQAVWLSVGDSRVYHVAEAKMLQLSKDDTLEGQLGKPIEGGRRSELLQFIGIGESLEPHIEPVPSTLSGTLLLTTDGVHFIDAAYLGKVAYFAQDLGVCARRFIDLAKMLGGPDNASVAALSLDALSGATDTQIDSAFEVWDPFGELCLLFEHAYRYPTHVPAPAPKSADAVAGSTASTKQADAPMDAPQELGKEASGTSASPNAVGTEKPVKRRSGGSRKAKPKPPKNDGAPGAEGEAPQLSIEFPHKRS